MEAKTRSRGIAALPPAASQIPGKYLCFLVARATEKRHVDPENLVLSLDEVERLRRGNGREGALASNVRSEQRTTASSGIVSACTRDIL